jgi:hypothetical protein
VDHLGGGMDRALAADEHDAPPVPLLHCRADTHGSSAPPLSTLTSKNRRHSSSAISPNGLWLENAEVVDENVHEREPLEQRLLSPPRWRDHPRSLQSLASGTSDRFAPSPPRPLSPNDRSR